MPPHSECRPRVSSANSPTPGIGVSPPTKWRAQKVNSSMSPTCRLVAARVSSFSGRRGAIEHTSCHDAVVLTHGVLACHTWSQYCARARVGPWRCIEAAVHLTDVTSPVNEESSSTGAPDAVGFLDVVVPQEAEANITQHQCRNDSTFHVYNCQCGYFSAARGAARRLAGGST